MFRALRTALVLASVLALAPACGAGHTSGPKRPVATAAAAPKERPRAFGPESIDAALREEWRRAGLVPAPRADDATFLRRAYVDIAGAIPPADVTARFLADSSAEKRARLVEALLASPDYAEHWTTYWDAVLMGREVRGNLVDRVAFRGWLRARFAAGTPWDRLVSELVSATGQNGLGGPKVKGPAMKLSTASPPPEAEREDDDPSSINGAVNWTLRFEQSPQDLAGNASRVFLGVQIQCAQCHDHKTESWKQDDFRRFASAFLRAKVEPIDRGKAMGMVKRVELVDAAKAPARFLKNGETGPLARSKATALDGTDLEKGAGTRKALAAWMTSKDNPWFAKAFVNRMWGHFLGRGFYDPVDDIRPSNPAIAPDLLDRITADFVAHDFDVKHLIRTICATEAYNLAASAAAKTDPENMLWARFHLVPLVPEELLNAVFRATDLERTAQKAGIDDVDALRANVVHQYAFLFDTDEEDDEVDYSGTITQALALLNGALVAQSSRALPGSALAELVAGPGTDAEKLDALALRVLARRATAEERTRWVAHVEAAADTASPGAAGKKAAAGKRTPLARLSKKRAPVTARLAAYEDVLWAMLNSSEFTFNH